MTSDLYFNFIQGSVDFWDPEEKWWSAILTQEAPTIQLIAGIAETSRNDPIADHY